MNSTRDKLAFFRQSGWMVIATVAGGIFMSAVHVVVSKPMRAPEYAVFNALLRVFLLMGFPAGGLQIVFAQQAAAAISEQEQRKLSETTRAVLRATFVIWIGMAAAVFLFRNELLASWGISNPAALWATVLLGLASLWSPIAKGLLQGRQNFAGLGWVMILDGVGRFTAIVLIVQLGGQAAGGMTGALIGQTVSLAFGAWLLRKVLSGPGAAFAWRPWLKKVIPLTIGVGVFLLLPNADVIFVQSTFSKDESPFYTPGAMIGLALISFTTPLASVMFPKIVHSAARTEKTDALRHALTATALLGVSIALAFTLFPQLPLRIIYFRSPRYWSSSPLVPWFAWGLLPLIIANVLIGNLLARERFRVVPWLLAVGVAYLVVLGQLKDRVVLFSVHDFTAPAALAHKLAVHSDRVSAFLWEQFPANTRAQLSGTNASSKPATLALTEAINKLLKGPSIYEAQRFAEVRLSEETQQLTQKNPQGKELIRLNRLALQDAFPSEIIPSATKLFDGFKMVIGTLGLFSSLLLIVTLGFTFLTRTQSFFSRPTSGLRLGGGGPANG